MKLSIHRLLLVSVVVTAIAFVTAGVAGNQQTGLRAAIGDTAWITTMVGTVVVAVLAVTALVQAAVRRVRARETA